MYDELHDKIECLKKIEPSEKNESIIRNLCQTLIDQARFLKCDINTKSKGEATEKVCYRILNELEENIILSRPINRFGSFNKFDIPLLVKNAVCACDVFLSKPFITLKNSTYIPFYGICNGKLITRAIIEEALYFSKNYNSGVVTFSSAEHASYFVLSAQLNTDKQILPIIDEKIFSVLEKTAKIHKGIFLMKFSKNSISLHLTLKNQNENSFSYRPAASYIDMLSDKTSVVYIILGGI